MKKLFLPTGLFLGLATAANAQSMNVKLAGDVCIDVLTAQYTDRTTENFAMGCGGTYLFTTGRKTVAAIVINGVTCYEGITEITAGDKTITVKAGHDEAKGPFSNIVVR